MGEEKPVKLEDLLSERMPGISQPGCQTVAYVASRIIESKDENSYVGAGEIVQHLVKLGSSKSAANNVLGNLKQLSFFIRGSNGGYTPTAALRFLWRQFKDGGGVYSAPTYPVRGIGRDELNELREIEKRELECEKLADLDSALEKLEYARAVGLEYVNNVRSLSETGKTLGKTDIRRVLAYMELDNLRQEDITEGNAGHVLDLIEWVLWHPRATYGGRPGNFYHCTICKGKIPVWKLVYPDGTKKTSLNIHKRECLKKVMDEGKK